MLAFECSGICRQLWTSYLPWQFHGPVQRRHTFLMLHILIHTHIHTLNTHAVYAHISSPKGQIVKSLTHDNALPHLPCAGHQYVLHTRLHPFIQVHVHEEEYAKT